MSHGRRRHIRARHAHCRGTGREHDQRRDSTHRKKRKSCHRELHVDFPSHPVQYPQERLRRRDHSDSPPRRARPGRSRGRRPWVEVGPRKRLRGCQEGIVIGSFEGLSVWRALVLLTHPGGVVVSVHAAPVTVSTIVVAVDVGKTSAMLSVTDSARKRLLGPVEFAMTRSGLAATAERVLAVAPPSAQVKVGVEAAGHYHRPVVDYRWPTDWEVLEFNPAHVAEQRRVAGRRRVKTDAIDLERSPSWRWRGEDSDHRPRNAHRGVGGLGPPPVAPCRHPYRDEESTTRSTRPRRPRVDPGVA